MLSLYTWKTPNGHKISIALDEMGLAYNLTPVDLQKNEQMKPDFLAIAPNNKIPVIDDDGVVVFESGAILWYLAEKTGQLLGDKAATLTWLTWASASFGPMCGQYMYFARRSETKVPEAIERFTQEMLRLLKVLEGQLAAHAFVAGDAYTVADIAAYTWAVAVLPEIVKDAGGKLGKTPATDRWLEAVGKRPSVVRGQSVPG